MKHCRVWLGLNLITICAVTLMLAGCISPSIFRKYEIDGDKVTSILIDAKQRAILAVHSPQLDMLKKNDQPTRPREVIVCAEPSPDALSSLSSLLNVSVGNGTFGFNDVKGVPKVEKLLKEINQKLGERNATIQLLRDGLYRQCEAYLNGVINKKEYKDLADRYIDGMVTLLAIERITPDPTDNAASGSETERASKEKDEQSSSHAKLPSEKAIEAVEDITRAFLAKNHRDKCIAFLNPDPNDPKPAALKPADKKPAIDLCLFIATSELSAKDRKFLLSSLPKLLQALGKNSGLNKETTSALGLTREKLTVTNETLGTTNENITNATTALDETKKKLTATSEILDTTNANLTNTTNALGETKKELTATNETLGTTNKNLDGTTAALRETKQELVDTLTTTNDKLGKATGALNQTTNKLTGATESLGKATDALNETKEELAATNSALGTTNEKLDEIGKSLPKSDGEAGGNAELPKSNEAKTSQETNGQVPDEGETADKKSQQ